MDVRTDAGSQSSTTSSVKCKQEVIIKEEDADKPENSRINSGLSIHCEQSHIKSEDTICKNEEKLLSKSDGYDTFFIKEEEEECLQQETTSHTPIEPEQWPLRAESLVEREELPDKERTHQDSSYNTQEGLTESLQTTCQIGTTSRIDMSSECTGKDISQEQSSIKDYSKDSQGVDRPHLPASIENSCDLGEERSQRCLRGSNDLACHVSVDHRSSSLSCCKSVQSKETSPGRPHDCSQCGTKFQKLWNLKEHKSKHNGEKPFPCSKCQQSYTRKRNLKRHLIMVHGVGNDGKSNQGETTSSRSFVGRPHACSDCDKRFSRLSRLKEHMYTHTGKKPFACSLCPSSFVRKHDLFRHSSRLHGVGQGGVSKQGDKVSSKRKDITQKQCHAQSESIKGFDGNAIERIDNTGDVPNNICKGNVSNSTVHSKTLCNEQTSLNRPHVCSQCGKKFQKMLSLKVHMYTHTGKKPFECSLCPQSFNRMKQLVRHSSEQHGNEVIECRKKIASENKDIAHNEKFVTNYMQSHDRGHNKSLETNQKQIHRADQEKIDITDEWEQHGNVHQEMHSQSDDILSKLGNTESSKSTSKGLSLKSRSHEIPKQLYTRPYACTQCGKRFKRTFNLKEHMYTHTGKKPFECSVCPKSFRRRTDLVNHLLKHHGVTVDQVSRGVILGQDSHGVTVDQESLVTVDQKSHGGTVGQDSHGVTIGQESCGVTVDQESLVTVDQESHGVTVGRVSHGVAVDQETRGVAVDQESHGVAVDQETRGVAVDQESLVTVDQKSHGGTVGRVFHGVTVDQKSHQVAVGQDSHGVTIGQESLVTVDQESLVTVDQKSHGVAIDQETRGVAVDQETRGLAVDQESLVTVDQKSHGVAVDQETRGVAIDQESHGVAVDQETRGVAVDQESHGVAVDQESLVTVDQKSHGVAVDQETRGVAIDQESHGVAVDQETRGVAVDQESHGLAVDQESLVSVDQKSHGVAVDQETRGVAIDQESHGVAVDQETRGVAVDQETRGLAVDQESLVTVDQKSHGIVVDQETRGVAIDQVSHVVTVDQESLVTVDQVSRGVTVDQVSHGVVVDEETHGVTVDQVSNSGNKSSKDQTEILAHKQQISKGLSLKSRSHEIPKQLYTRPYACAQCGKRFKRTNHLKEHMYTHTGKKPFECSLCPKSFRRRTDLVEHLLRHHGINVDQDSYGVTADQVFHGVSADQGSLVVTVDQKSHQVAVGQDSHGVIVGQESCGVTVVPFFYGVTVDQESHQVALYQDSHGLAVDQESGVAVDQETRGVAIDQMSDVVTVDQESHGVTVDQVFHGVAVDLETPGVAVDLETPGVAVDLETPGVAVDQESHGLAVDQASLVSVDQKSRGVAVDQETRGVAIDQESDVVTVDQESHGLAVDQKYRGVAVDQETRGVAIDQVSDVVTVDQESLVTVDQVFHGVTVDQETHGVTFDQVFRGVAVDQESLGTVDQVSPGVTVDQETHGVAVDQESFVTVDLVSPGVAVDLVSNSGHESSEDQTEILAHKQQISKGLSLKSRSHDIPKHTRPYACTQCGKRFKKTNHLIEHMDTHTGKKPFMCCICQRSFARKRALVSHSLKVHGFSYDQLSEQGYKFSSKLKVLVYKLPVEDCLEKINSPGDKQRHQQTHSEDQEQPKTMGQHQDQGPVCVVIHSPLCNFKDTLLDSEGIQPDVIHGLGNVEESEYTGESRNEGEQSQLSEGSDAVKINSLREDLSSCMLSLKLREEYTKSKQPNESLESSVSEILDNNRNTSGESTSNTSPSNAPSYVQSEECSLGSPYVCAKSGSRFSKLSNLKEHMYQHSSEKPYVCSICQQSFIQKRSLLRHSLRHHGISKDYLSRQGNRFSTKLKGTTRKQLHVVGESKKQLDDKFKCHFDNTDDISSEIGKTNESNSTVLSKVLYTDFEQRITSVSNPQATIQETNRKQLQGNMESSNIMSKGLSLNSRSHEIPKPYSCSVCGKKFRNTSHRKEHMYTHTGKKPFECSLCPKSFRRRAQVVDHSLSIHGVTVDQVSCGVTADQESHGVAVDQVSCGVTADQESHGVAVDQESCGVTADQVSHVEIVDQESHGVAVDQVSHEVAVDQVSHGVAVDQVSHGVAVDQVSHGVAVDQVSHGVAVDQVSHRVTVDQETHVVTIDQESHGVTVDQDSHVVTIDRVSNSGNKSSEYHTEILAQKKPISKGISLKSRSREIPKPYGCSVCGKKFRNTSHRKEHMYTHTGKKPFECSLCPKSFRRRAQVVDHSLSIHGVTVDQVSCGVTADQESHGVAVDQESCGVTADQVSHVEIVDQESHGVAVDQVSHEVAVDQVSHGVAVDQVSHGVAVDQVSHGVAVDQVSHGVAVDQVSHRVTVDQETHVVTVDQESHGVTVDQDSHVVTIDRVSNSGNKSSEYHTEILAQKKPISKGISLKSRSREIPKPYGCSVCGKKFRYTSHRKEHMYTHTGKKPFECSLCPKSFRRRAQFVDHSLSFHGVTVDQVSYSEKHPIDSNQKDMSDQDNMQISHGKDCTDHNPSVHTNNDTLNYRCACGESFHSFEQLTVHTKTVGGGEPMKCPNCDEVFCERSSYICHILMHLEKNHKCPECEQTFRWSYELTAHMKSHLTESKENKTLPTEFRRGKKSIKAGSSKKDRKYGTYVCSQCNKRFRKSSCLREHIAYFHTGEKYLSCSKCSSTFVKRKSLIWHSAKHHGVVLDQICECGKGFSSKAEVIAHITTHGTAHDQGNSNEEESIKVFHNSDSNMSLVETQTSFKEPQLSKEMSEKTRSITMTKDLFDDYDDDQMSISSELNGRGTKSDESSSALTVVDAQRENDQESSLEELSDQTVDERLCSCSECQQRFPGKLSLLQHLMRCHEDILKKVCECGERFASEEALYSHQRGLVKCNKCPICKKTFEGQCLYKLHMEMHAELQYKCTECEDKFALENQLINHLKFHTGGKPFACSMCKASFSQDSSLAEHMQMHKKENLYECVKCGILFVNANEICEHDLKVHKHRWCPVCDKHFHASKEYEEHMQTHKKDPIFECLKCRKQYPHLESLKRHATRHDESRILKCLSCDKLFIRENLRKHVKWHRSIRPHKCIQCGKGFVNKNELKKHIVRVHTKRIPALHLCHICGRACVSEARLLIHVESVHKKQEFHTCPDCGYSVASKQLLSQHLYICRGGKPYKCTICQDLFSDKYELNRHIKRHAGKNQCPVCKRQFKSISDVNLHVRRVHTGERPFQCSQCPARCVGPSALKVHMTWHYGVKRFKCPLCRKAFITTTSRNRHLKKVHKEVNYLMCDKCGERFSGFDEILNHRKRLYKETPHLCVVCENRYQTICELTVHLKTHSN
ncbi:uncharacterized protein LOC129266487 [Lytechinus pictus]|uniref:uncharacterized protein LOC129266487 n=1 Tax=Lytechinus pictus TaxID=7653 RepID=UPI0030B9F7D8